MKRFLTMEEAVCYNESRANALCFAQIFADVAHLVERHLAKVEVASSSLVIRSKFFSEKSSLL